MYSSSVTYIDYLLPISWLKKLEKFGGRNVRCPSLHRRLVHWPFSNWNLRRTFLKKHFTVTGTLKTKVIFSKWLTVTDRQHHYHNDPSLHSSDGLPITTRHVARCINGNYDNCSNCANTRRWTHFDLCSHWILFISRRVLVTVIPWSLSLSTHNDYIGPYAFQPLWYKFGLPFLPIWVENKYICLKVAFREWCRKQGATATCHTPNSSKICILLYYMLGIPVSQPKAREIYHNPVVWHVISSCLPNAEYRQEMRWFLFGLLCLFPDVNKHSVW